MKFGKYCKLILFSLLVSSVAANAQKNEDIIMKAMCDEMNRNMKELKNDENEKPFFIAYNAHDGKTLYIFGEYGALVNSVEVPIRYNNVRLMVGDYTFNDESLDNTISSPPTLEETSMPLEDDYQGIRRSLWIATDNVFKGACKHLERNKLNLAEQKKQLEEIPHRSFVQVSKSEVIEDHLMPVYNKASLETYVRDLSALFINYPQLENSGVVLSFTFGNNYFVNSEGTRSKVFESFVSLSGFATMKAVDGDKIYDLVQHYYSGLEQLPDKAILESEIKAMLAELDKKSKADLFSEDYSGPVLFEGSALGELYAQNLFSSNNGLMASNSINTGNGGRFEGVNSLESKMGKPVFSDKLSIVASPKAKFFKNQELLGSFQVDDEGVIPPDELILVEKGIVKNLLNDRTITKADQQANGHRNGPGVITFKFSEQLPIALLKANLIKEAKEQGLEYALIVKSMKGAVGNSDGYGAGAFDIYKVSLLNGEETYVRSAYVSDMDNKIFKKVMQASNQTTVFNVLSGSRNSSAIWSFISPDALLLKQVDVKGSDPNFFKEDTFVKSPLFK